MPSPFTWRRHGLYLLTPDEADDDRLLDSVSSVLRARPALLQYRNKTLAAAARKRQASAVADLCRAHKVPLIVNDDPQLALAVGAEGVHLGRTDGSIAAARALLGPRAIIGVSCYADIERAQFATAEGADYLAFGAFFPSPTKPSAARADLDLLARAAALNRPRVAIGGIDESNALILRAAGADLIAVLSAVFHVSDPYAAALRLQSLYANC